MSIQWLISLYIGWCSTVCPTKLWCGVLGMGMQKNQQFCAKWLSFTRDWSNKIGVHSVSKLGVWSQAIATKPHSCASHYYCYYIEPMRITNHPPMHFASYPNEFNIHSPLKWLFFNGAGRLSMYVMLILKVSVCVCVDERIRAHFAWICLRMCTHHKSGLISIFNVIYMNHGIRDFGMVFD